MSDLIDRAVAWVKSPSYLELTTRQLAILGVVMGEDEPIRVRDLARTLRLQKPVVSRAVNVLQGMGFIARTKGADKRDRFISVTDAGRVFRSTIGGAS